MKSYCFNESINCFKKLFFLLIGATVYLSSFAIEASIIGANSRPDKTGWAIAWDCNTSSTLYTGKAAKDALLYLGFESSFNQYSSAYSSKLTSGVFVVLSSTKDGKLGVGFGAHESSWEIAKIHAIDNLTTYHWAFNKRDPMTIEYRSSFSCTDGTVSVEVEGNLNGQSSAPYAPPSDEHVDEDIDVITPEETIIPAPNPEHAYLYFGAYFPSQGLIDELHIKKGDVASIKLGVSVSPYFETQASFELDHSTDLALDIKLVNDGAAEAVTADLETNYWVRRYNSDNRNLDPTLEIDPGYRSYLEMTPLDTANLPVGAYKITVHAKPEFTYDVYKSVYLVVHDVNWDGQLSCCANPAGDFDEDGHANSGDAFPTDPAEHADSDGDGVGNNADLDDDNDSAPDEWELMVGSNPYRVDSDSDGLVDGYEMDLGTSPLHQQYQVAVGFWSGCLLKVAQDELVCTNYNAPNGIRDLRALDGHEQMFCVAHGSNSVSCWGVFEGKVYPKKHFTHEAGDVTSMYVQSVNYGLDPAGQALRICLLGSNGVKCYSLSSFDDYVLTPAKAPIITDAFSLIPYLEVGAIQEKVCAVKTNGGVECWLPGSDTASSVNLGTKVFDEDGLFSKSRKYEAVGSRSCMLMFDMLDCLAYSDIYYVADIDNNGVSDRNDSLTYLGLYTHKFSRLHCDGGVDQTVNEGDLVSLNALNTELNPLSTTYSWELAQGGRGSFDQPGINAEYTAPTVGVDDGRVYLRLNCDNPDNGDQNEAIVQIDIKNINHVPVPDASATFRYVEFGKTMTLDGSNSYDADNDPLVIHWSFDGTLTSGCTFNPYGSYPRNTAVVSFTGPTESCAMKYTLYVDDRSAPQQSLPITIFATGPNTKPVVSIAGTTVNEGQEFTLTVDATDQFGYLQYHWVLPPELLDQAPDPKTEGSSITLIAPELSSSKTLLIGIEVTDGHGATVTKSAGVTVNDVTNQLPVATLSSTTVNKGETFTLTVDASDPDGESAGLSYNWILPAELDGQTAEGSSITLTAPQVDNYTTLDISVEVTDSRGGKVVAAANVGIYAIINYFPIVSLSDVTANEAESFTLTVDATDPDGDDNNLSYHWVLPDELKDQAPDPDNQSHTLTLIGPELASTSTLSISVEVTDIRGATVVKTAAVTVNDISNIPPYFNIPDLILDEGEIFTLTVTDAVDPDGDTSALTYDWVLHVSFGDQAPAPGSNTNTITLTAPQVEEFSVMGVGITVTDSRGATLVRTATIQINDVPQSTPEPDSSDSGGGAIGSLLIPLFSLMMLSLYRRKKD